MISENKNGVVKVEFTIGFGNNLFQYCYARIIAEKNNMLLSHPPLKEFNIPESRPQINNNYKTVVVNDSNSTAAFAHRFKNCNILISGYFENYKFYKDYIQDIKEWFPKVGKTNNNDLILHLRLQNRLVQTSHHKNHIPSEGFKEGIREFEYDRLHIITDAKKWSEYERRDILEIQEEVRIGPNPTPSWVSVEQSLYYMNSLINGLNDLNPIVHCSTAPVIPNSGGLRSGHMKDFDFIRSFDKIMIFNSTFSWWAAALSEASVVGTWKPWKPSKGIGKKNLGITEFTGWFSWGSEKQLYWR